MRVRRVQDGGGNDRRGRGVLWLWVLGVMLVGGDRGHVVYGLDTSDVASVPVMRAELQDQDVTSEEMMVLALEESGLGDGVYRSAMAAVALGVPAVSGLQRILGKAGWWVALSVAVAVAIRALTVSQQMQTGVDLVMGQGLWQQSVVVMPSQEDGFDETVAFYQNDIELHQLLREGGPEDEKRFIVDLEQEEKSARQELNVVGLEISYQEQERAKLEMEKEGMIVLHNYVRDLIRTAKQRQEEFERTRSLKTWREAIDRRILESRMRLHDHRLP